MSDYKKEIGGYLQLEEFTGAEYHQEALGLNLGRTALIYMLSLLKCEKLLVPYYLCDSLTAKCESEGIALRHYYVDERLTPLIDWPLEEGEYLLLVNHYGQLSDEKITTYQKRYQRIIVDHTHSFFQKPLPGVPTFYSCRKFFGLADGAYLYTGGLTDGLTDGVTGLPPKDISNGRMRHVLGRYEESAGVYFAAMHESAASFYQEPVKEMSALTRNLLRGIDYQRVRARRNDNAAVLHQHLGRLNGLDWPVADGPLAYPFYVKNGKKIRALLAGEKIFVPTYWNNVIAEQNEDMVEHRYAANILPLPCDQRYSRGDMERVAGMVKKILEM